MISQTLCLRIFSPSSLKEVGKSSGSWMSVYHYKLWNVCFLFDNRIDGPL